MAGQSTAPAEAAISFGAFRLYPRRQLLLQGDKPVRLGSRALDVLTALVERAGEVVTKKELIARVWPETFVEEGNLRVHIAGLRRALGDGQAGQRYVANVPGRGYRFVASVVVSEARMPIAPVSTPTPAHNLPARLTHMIGRDAVVDTIAAQLPQRRLITIAGPGGIGKTTVALAVADRLLPGYRDGVRFIELASVAGDPASLLTAVASALGAPAGTADAAAITAFLRDKELLLVLDSCEHTIEAAATFAVDALRTAPGLSILATSREPMRAEGERVQRLAPLDAPPPSCNPTASEALAFPAVQLLVERVSAAIDGFELSDADAPLAAEICHRLDGIPLAIELATGRVDALGLRGLATALHDRFQVLTANRRTALPRHRTLGATLDWSWDFLPEGERIILRRLAVFDWYFTQESALRIIGTSEMAACDVMEGVANLVAKSLVAADITGEDVHYRLLGVTRAYALEKLRESGELDEAMDRQARDRQEVLARAGLGPDGKPLMGRT